MSLLALDRVSKRYAHISRERVALSGVSMEVDAGELFGIVGRRRSGRTTLLLVAAGIEPPSDGMVLFADRPLRAQVLGARGGISLCTTDFPAVVGSSVVEHVAAPLLGAGVALGDAHGRAHALLQRVGATATVEIDPSGLDSAEAIRVGLARALACEPRVLLVDDPVLGVRLSERDKLLELLGSIAHQDGIAVVMTVDDAAELAGCDRAASLDSGELRGETTPAAARVIPFERRRSDTRA